MMKLKKLLNNNKLICFNKSELKSYFSILIYFVFLILIFSNNMAFATSCNEIKERASLDYCRNTSFDIGNADMDGNKPITKNNIGFNTFNPYINPEYFYDKRNKYCLIWGIVVSSFYATASIAATAICSTVGGSDAAEKAVKISKIKKVIGALGTAKKVLGKVKSYSTSAVGEVAISVFTDPIITLQVELALDMIPIGVKIVTNTATCVSSLGASGCGELGLCVAAGGLLAAALQGAIFGSTGILYKMAETQINKVKLCGYDWENYVYTKHDMDNYNEKQIYPQKGKFSNSYSYKLEKCFRYGTVEAKSEFNIDCTEVTKNYCDLGSEKCKNISITSKNFRNRLYREIINNGKEFKISTNYHSKNCIDPRPEEEKGFSGLEQRYYFRGTESAHYLCNRFKFRNQGCVLEDGTKISVDELSDPVKKAKCKQVFEQAYACCKNRAALGACIYNVKDTSNYGRDTKDNAMCLRQLDSDDGVEECEVDSISGTNPKFIAFTAEDNVSKICVRNVNFCPYSYNLDGGTIAKDEYCDGDYSCSHSTCDLKYSDDEDKRNDCKNKMSEEIKRIWDIENGNKIPTPSYGKVKNFLSYNAHCTDIGDLGKNFVDMPNNKYLPKVCSDFVGDSKNLPIPVYPVDLNSDVSRNLVAGVDFDLGKYRGFTAPIAQCFKETLSNMFNNRAGVSLCKDPDEEINAEGLCGNDSFDHPEKIDKEKYVYMIGDKLPDDENIFYKIQSRLQLIIKLFAVLAIIVIGINFLLKGDLNIFGDIKKPKILIVGMVKFAIVFYFAVGNAWQTHFYKWLDDALGYLYKKTFELSLLNYKVTKTNSKELKCTKIEEKTTYKIDSEMVEFYNNSEFEIPNNAISLKLEVYGASGSNISNTCYGGNLRTTKDSFLYEGQNFDYTQNYANGEIFDAGCLKGNENCEYSDNENSCWNQLGRYMHYYQCSNGVWKSYGYCGDEKLNESEPYFIFEEKVVLSYTKDIQSFEIPDNVFAIKAEAYGAPGGGSNCGKGGYARGMLSVSPGERLYVVVGGNGSCSSSGGPSTAGYNGGGYDETGGCGGNRGHGCGGGGATHMARTSGLLKDLLPKDVLLVAGGGGGKSEGTSCGGAGGGANLSGNNGVGEWKGFGGTVSGGGSGNNGNGSGSFGLGGNVTRRSTDSEKWCGGAGGGGYYGGGAGEWAGPKDYSAGGGGGGSGFCGNGMQNCYGESGISKDPEFVLHLYYLIRGEDAKEQNYNFGGYSYGNLDLKSNSLGIKNGDILYVNVGKSAKDNSSAGATDIRINNLSNLTCGENDPRIIVAGAGGNRGGAGGGGNGNGGDAVGSSNDGKGGTLNAGGITNGVCGFGGVNSNYASGGNGWYGGGYGINGGGGGSGYVSSALSDIGGIQGGNTEKTDGYALISIFYNLPIKSTHTNDNFIIKDQKIIDDIIPQITIEKCYSDGDDKICYTNCEIIDAKDSSGNQKYIWNERYDGCYFGDEKYPEGKGYLALFDSLDCKLMNYFNYTPDLDLPGILIMILISLLWSPLAIVAVLLGSIFFIIMLSLVIKIFYVFLMSFFAMNIMIYISPIIFPFLLFKKYKNVFDTWLSKLIGYSLQLIFISVFAGFVIITLDKFAIGDNKYINHDPLTGRLPIINCDQNKSSSLICVFNVSTNKGQAPAFGNAVRNILGIGPMVYLIDSLSKDFVGTVVTLLKSCLILYVLLQFMQKMNKIIYEITGTGAFEGGNVGIKEKLTTIKDKVSVATRVARYSAITLKDTSKRIGNEITGFGADIKDARDEGIKNRKKEDKGNNNANNNEGDNGNNND